MQSPLKMSARRPQSPRIRWRIGTLVALALLFPAAILYPSAAKAQLQLPGLPKPAAAPAPAVLVPPPPPATPPDLAIPLPQIANEAETLDLKLDEISRQLSAQRDELARNPVTAEQAAEISDRAHQVDAMLNTGPDILQLREEIVYWRSLSQLSAFQRKLLTARADELQNQVALLVQEQARWQATQDEIHDTAGIEVVAARVQHELDAIRDIRVKAQTQLNQVLTLQNELSETGRKISDSLARLTEAEARFSQRVSLSLRSRMASSLWSRRATPPAPDPMVVLLRLSPIDCGDALPAVSFCATDGIGLLFIPIAFFVSLIAAFRLRNYLSTRKGPGISARAHALFAHPIAIALLLTLLLCTPLTQSAPLSVTAAIYVLWLGLLSRFTPILVEPEMRSLVYLLLTLNFLEILRAVVPVPPVLRQSLLPFLILTVLIAFGWLARASRLHRLPMSKWSRIWLLIGSRIGLILLAVALLANAFGFVSLSRALGVGTLLSAFIACGVFFVVRVLRIALAVLLESPLLSAVSIEMRGSIQLWTTRFLIVLGVVLWWTRSELFVLMLQESLGGSITDLLDYPIGLGKMHFTLGNVLIVLLILVIGLVLAKGISSVLRSVLASKFPLQRGLPYAVSKVTYYCLCVVVALAAVSAAGVELNRFTVITGAVGVGLGFGLQDIARRTSPPGLHPALRERPIRVDDTVEVNNLTGIVKRIGARSSTISTAQGAEVIVPNSTLVSSHVINWTLSSPWRRVEIPVGVAYGTDPEFVMKLLVAEAAGHPNVMTDPEPVAFFMGFGDSALNFELRFWSARQDIWFQVKSDITVAVSRALSEAGIEIPFPQRDLHLRSSADSSIANPAQLIAQPQNGTKVAAADAENKTTMRPETESSSRAGRLADPG